MLITEKMKDALWVKNHLLLVLLFVTGSVAPFVAESQPLLSETRAGIMKNNAVQSVEQYYDELNLIGNTNEDNSDREMYIESAVRRMYDENVIVFNDLGSDGVSNFGIREYLNTLQTRFHVDPGVQFKLEIKDTLGLYEAKKNEMFAFTIVRVEREMTYIDSADVEELNRVSLNFFLRFDINDDRWNNEPKIYDIRKAEPDIESQFKKFPIAKGIVEEDETLQKSGTGELAIKTQPSDCSIILDGLRLSDVTPYSNTVHAGKMRVVLEKENHEKIDTIINVVPDEKTTLDVELKPITGRIKIATTPSGADVYINGMRSGQTPFDKEMLVGRYSIEIKKSGHRAEDFVKVLREGETENHYFELKNLRKALGPTKVLKWSLVGIGVGGLATGGYFLMENINKYDEYENADTDPSALRQNVQQSGLIYPIALAAGGVALIGALLVNNKLQKKKHSLGLAAVAVPQGAGVALTFNF